MKILAFFTRVQPVVGEQAYGYLLLPVETGERPVEDVDHDSALLGALVLVAAGAPVLPLADLLGGEKRFH